MKTILILGSGKDQLPAIKKSRELGYSVISCDYKKNPVGKKFSDFFWNVSSTDVNKLSKKIRKFENDKKKIDGIFLMGTDLPQIAAKLSKFIKTKIYKNFSSKYSKNKLLMKELFKKKKINIPNFKEIKNFSQLINYLRDKKKIVIKPLDLAGSRGVYLIKKNLKYSKIKNLYTGAKSFTKLNSLIAEEFLEGPQLSTETIVVNNKTKTIGFADRNYEFLKKFEPKIIENGGTMPSKYLKTHFKDVQKTIEKIKKTLKISNGVIKGDLVIHKKKIYVIEIAYRLSGGDFSESLIPLNTGIDFIKLALQQSVGEKISLRKIKIKNKLFVMNRYFFPKEGVLKKIEGIKKIKNKDFIKKIDFNYKKNQRIPTINSHKDRGGVFVIVGKNYQEANQRVKFVYSKIKFLNYKR